MEPIQRFRTMNSEVHAIAQQIFDRKRAARREAARLPIEEKLRILVRLQQQTNEIRRAAGRPEMFVWKID